MKILEDPKIVWHWGNLDMDSPAQIGRLIGNSHEGSGLSVSTHPDAWRVINKMGGKTCYRLHKDDPLWIDGHEQENEKIATQWAKKMGLISKDRLWKIVILTEDDEYAYFSQDREKLVPEMEDAIDSGHQAEISPADAWRLTDKGRLFYELGREPPIIMIPDHALTWYGEYMGFDGVWWDDELAPHAYSAPRGVIFQSILAEWEIVQDRDDCAGVEEWSEEDEENH